MSQISYTPVVDGDQPLASGFNSRWLLAINLLNSGVESDNIASSAVTATKISSGAVTTTKLSHPILQVKGSDIASATTTDLSTATGNCVDITGTTTITALGTQQAGTVMYLRFIGVLTLTYNATSLILPSSANITTAAGDTATFESLGSGNWVCHNYQRRDGTPVSASGAGATIQTVNTQTGEVATGSTAMPDDDTIPQNTEGTQFMTLAVTPTNTNNKLQIDVVAVVASSGSTQTIAGLFQDSTASALAVACCRIDAVGRMQTLSFTHYMTAGTTSSTTFKIRIGDSAGGTITFNGTSGGRKFGGVMASSITIKEIKV